MPTLNVIILAAGKGTRMRSARAKVLHEVFYQPMVRHVVTATALLRPDRTLVVIGHQGDQVRAALADAAVECIVQEEQLGTGHAVLATEAALGSSPGTVLILCGDTPLIQSETLQHLCQAHRREQAAVTFLTTTLADPTNYGRVVCNEGGAVQAIVEQKDASPSQLAINEINAGIYCTQGEFLFAALKKVTTANSQGELYLTDIIALAVAQGLKVCRHPAGSPVEVLGVNSRLELAEAQRQLQLRRNHELMAAGVSMYNPETIRIAPGCRIGQDSLLEAGVVVEGGSLLGSSCRIGQGAVLSDCRLGDGVRVGPYSCLEGCTLPAGAILPAGSRG